MALDILSALQVTIETVKKYVDNLVIKKADVAQGTSNAGKVWTVADDGGLTFSDGSAHSVQYVPQTLDEEQKLQARNNIGVGETIADTLISLELAKPLVEDDNDILADVDGIVLVYDKNDELFVKTVNGIEPDENGNVEIEVASGSGGGVSSWNDLEDKPFEVAAKIYEYNSNTTYDEVIVVSEEESLELVKISDDVVESDMFIGGSIAIQATLDGETLTESTTITEDMIASIDGAYVISDGCIVVTAESVQYPFADIDLVIPRGVWIVNLAKVPINNVTIEYARFLSRSTPLPEYVIPDTIARVEDITWENIPDKPFYNSHEEVIPEQEYSIAIEDVVYRVLPDADFEKIEEGKTYVVNCRGGIKTCIAQKYEDQFISGIILGNPWWAGGNGSSNNGLDFAVVYRENDDGTIFKKVYVVSVVNAMAMTFGVRLIVPICLDETFIPDTIARKSEVISTPVTAQVGQTIVVKAIDENGKPTEWECVDMPSWIPEITEADEGAVLRVVNGVPTWVQDTDAQDATF